MFYIETFGLVQYTIQLLIILITIGIEIPAKNEW